MRRGRIALALIAVAVAVVATLAAVGSSALGGTSSLELHRIGTFEEPVYVDGAPAFHRLLFVVEQPGRISVLRGGHRLDHPFLDLRERVNSDGAERGLLSVAFPPDYRHSRRFYVYYTNAAGNNEVDEFERSRHDPTRALASSRRRVLLLPHPGEANHNGGQLQFGPDGYLYVATGDGGGSGDSGDNARHLDVLLGKLLRIDPRQRGARPYTVPASNPFVDRRGARPEVYAYGLRNPWRFSFDPVARTIAIGDVGQNSEEEVDYTSIGRAKGANFGWPKYEGDSVYDVSRPDPNPNPPRPTFPMLTYSHSDGCAVIGGYVVHRADLGWLNGRYLYSDLCNGQIRSLVASAGRATRDRATGLQVGSPSSFGEGPGGRIYVASHSGPVYRLRQAP